MSQRFTRQEFYELVWSKPLTHLAKDFRLSDVALHKICRKHDIPNPPLGWWAKHAAGHLVKRIPLPESGPGVSDSVVIASGELRDEPGDIAEAREQARVRLSEFDTAAPAQTHPLVARVIAKLRSAKVAENGLVSIEGKDLIPLEVAPGSIDRLELSLNRIVAAAHAQGFELNKTAERVAFTDGMVSIPFAIKETVKRSKHEPTPDELAVQERDRKAQERRWARFDRNYASLPAFSRPWPEWDYNPTGQLSFEFDVHLGYSALPAVRRSFRDAKVQRLENLAPDIAVGLAVIAVAKQAYDRKVVEDRLRAEEEKARRIEAQRRSHIEERRGKVLGVALERIERRDRLRDLVSQLSAELGDEPDARVAEFVRWSGETLARAEVKASAAGLAQLFEAERIFGDDDDSGFYPSANGW